MTIYEPIYFFNVIGIPQIYGVLDTCQVLDMPMLRDNFPLIMPVVDLFFIELVQSLRNTPLLHIVGIIGGLFPAIIP